MSTETLAERCYYAERAGDELFERIHELLGGADIKDCASPTFYWPCEDCWVDYYDGSVEVVLSNDQPPLTREQADAILSLGFGQIYESPTGALWTKAGRGQCSVRDAHQVSGLKVAALRAKIRELEALLPEK